MTGAFDPELMRRLANETPEMALRPSPMALLGLTVIAAAIGIARAILF